MLKLSANSKFSSWVRRMLVLGLFAAGCLHAAAQGTVPVTGTVTNAKNEPLAGAQVVETGTKQGISTDATGKFTLNVSSLNATLEVSYMGMKTETVKLAGRSRVTVTMAEDGIVVDGVVVTALGIKRESKALGYAVSQVNSEDLTAGREQNVMSAMIGKVAGVDISNTTAGPSGSTRVLIRGNSQLSGSNLPLYVVDGVPVDNSPVAGDVGKNGGYDYGDVLGSINPDDIESISVLKGASASALYGSDASNGVIMITTKQAKQGKALGIEISSNVSIVKLLTRMEDYQRVYGMGRQGTPPLTPADGAATQSAWGGKLDPNYMSYIYNGEMMDYGNKNNNIFSFFDTGVTYTNNLALNGSTDRSTFRFSVSDMRDNDIVPKSDLSRTTLTMRGSSKLSRRITIDGSATYTIEQVNNRPALSDNSSNIGNALMNIAPSFDQSWLSYKYKDEKDQYYNWNGDSYRFNPYWIINEMENNSKRNRLIGQARFTWDFTDWLKFSFRGGLDTYSFKSMEYTPPSTPRFVDGAINERTMEVMQTSLEAMLTYTKKICDFDLTAFVGANLFRFDRDIYQLSGTGQELPGVKDLNAFKTKTVVHENPRKEKRSLFGSVSLGYKGFAYLDATIRNDVSSALYQDNRSYVYPSVSGSLIFSSLIKNHGDWLSFGKIRASWANVGGDFDPYRLSLTFNLKPYTVNGAPLGQVSSDYIPNFRIKPTTTFSTEVGTEMKFFRNRLGFDLTLYKTDTYNQIMDLPVAKPTGFSKALINAGHIENKGIELLVTAVPVQTKKVTWETTFSYSKNLNKVVTLHPDVPNYELASARWANAFIYAQEDQPYGVIVGKKIRRSPDGRMIVNNGLPVFEDNVSVLGNGNYDYIMGWTNNVTWKGVTLTTVIDAKIGADIYSMSKMTSYVSGTSEATLEGREGWYKSEQARLSANKTPVQWTATGGYLADGVTETVSGGVTTYADNTVYVDPALYWQNYQNNSPEPFICDASFIKLREMSLSYNLPSKWLRRTPLQSVGVSAYGRNLWVISKHVDNIDPESSYNNGNGQGFEYGSLPSRRTFGFGINVKF